MRRANSASAVCSTHKTMGAEMTVILIVFAVLLFIFMVSVTFCLFNLAQQCDELRERVTTVETKASVTKAKASDMALAIKQHEQNIALIKKELRR